MQALHAGGTGRYLTLALTGGALLAASIGSAMAQPAQQQPAQQRALDEVVVTATRRGEIDLQTAPVAVSSLSAEEFDALIPNDLGDIALTVPNFSAARMAGFNAASFAIRGVGQTDIIVYLDSPVGVTVDDFVLPHAMGMLIEPYDIERIEVLRGPQGTLFGKNTTGGVVNVITKRPDLEQGNLDFRARAGSFNRAEVQAGLDIPLIDNQLGLRVAGMYRESDGYYRNGGEFGPIGGFIDVPGVTGETVSGDGSRAGGQEVFSSRIKLLWEPTDDFSALLQVERMRDRSDNIPALYDTPPDGPFVFNLLGFERPSGNPLNNVGTTNEDRFLLGIGEGQKIDIDGIYLNLEWSVGDYTINSVTGYREQDNKMPNTYTGIPGPISLFDANRSDERETFQQEVRLTSNFDGPVNFTTGLFYQENDAAFCVAQVLGFLDLLGLGLENFGDPLFFSNNPQVLCNAQDAEAVAAFGDVTWDLTDRWQIGAGIRYTREKKSWTGRRQVFTQELNGGFDPEFTWEQLDNVLEAGDFNRFPDGVVSDSETWSDWSGRLTASYLISDDLYGYLTFSRGFKSGGYNDQTGTTGLPIDGDVVQPYDPEYANSWELGLKADLLDNRLRINTAAFYVNYKDAQRALVATLENQFGQQFQETRFFNAADVEVYGLEFEVTALLTDDLQLNANLGWLDAEYKTFEADTTGDGNIDVDLSGLPITRAPELQATLGLTYFQEVSQLNGRLIWNVTVSYEDENVNYYSDIDPAFNAVLDERTLIDASLTYRSADDRWWVRGYGKNLTDKRYRIASQAVADLWTFTQFGAPRHYGLEFGLNFDF